MNKIFLVSSLVVFTGTAYAYNYKPNPTIEDCKQIKKLTKKSGYPKSLTPLQELEFNRKWIELFSQINDVDKNDDGTYNLYKGEPYYFYKVDYDDDEIRDYSSKSADSNIERMSEYYFHYCSDKSKLKHKNTITKHATITVKVKSKPVTVRVKDPSYTVTVRKPITTTVTDWQVYTTTINTTATVQNTKRVTAKITHQVEPSAAAGVVGISLLMLLAMGVAVRRAQYKYKTAKEEVADALSKLKIEEDKYEQQIKELERQLARMADDHRIEERAYKLHVSSLELSFNNALNNKIDNKVKLLNDIKTLQGALESVKQQRTKLELELQEYRKMDGEITAYKEDRQKLIDNYTSQIKILEDSNPNAYNISVFADMCKKQGLVMQRGERSEAKDLPGIYMHMMPNGKAYVGMAKTQPLKRRWDCGKNIDDELNNYNPEFTADMHRFGGPKSVRTIWAYVPIEWEKHTVESIESALILAGDYTNTGYNRKR